MMSVSVSGRESKLMSDEPRRWGLQRVYADKERADGVGADDLNADHKPRGFAEESRNLNKERVG